MEYLNAIGSFINSCGFPIAMCIALLYFASKHIVPYIAESTKSNREVSETLKLMNERVKGVEDDVSNIKVDMSGVKNDINSIKEKIK